MSSPIQPTTPDIAPLDPDRSAPGPAAPTHPGVTRRVASMVYEALLLTALILVMTFPFVGMTGGKITLESRAMLQVYLLVVCGAYFLWFWLHGGQTLPMKTWNIRLVGTHGTKLTARQAVTRYCCAIVGIAAGGIGLWWAWLDKDRQFLHDRLAGTRLVDATPR